MITKIKNLKISKKLSVSLFVSMGMLILTIIISVASLLLLNGKVTSFYDGIYTVKGLAAEISKDFESQQKYMFYAIAISDQETIEKYTASANDIGTEIRSLMDELDKIYTGDPSITQKIRDDLDVSGPLRDQIAELAVAQRNDEALKVASEEWLPAVTDMMASLNSLNEYADTEGDLVISQLQW